MVLKISLFCVEKLFFKKRHATLWTDSNLFPGRRKEERLRQTKRHGRIFGISVVVVVSRLDSVTFIVF